MKNWVSYNNGNYKVSLNLENGTKIRENDLDSLVPDFPENIDLKITDYCDAGCLFCHENSTKQGSHGSINHAFLNTLNPWTELAIGGGNPLDHPELTEFLQRMKSQNIVCNLTVNQIHFEKRQDYIEKIMADGLVYGLGVSMIKPTDKLISLVKNYKNAIIHTINGVTSLEQYKKLAKNDLKILILGYKYLRRGVDFYSQKVEKNKEELSKNLSSLLKDFSIVSFDNLALEQLTVRRLISDEYWNEFYMGDDGSYTMFIDLVKEEFSSSSTSKDRYNLKSNIRDMFNIIRSYKQA